MRNEHEAGIRPISLLLCGADRNAVLREDSSDRVEHTWLICDVEPKQVLGRGLINRPDRCLGERAERTVRACTQVDGCIDDITAVGAPPAPRP